MRLTGRARERIDLVRAYARAQGLFRTDSSPDPLFTDVLELDLANVEPSLAGPKRPQDRVPLRLAKAASKALWQHLSKAEDRTRLPQAQSNNGRPKAAASPPRQRAARRRIARSSAKTSTCTTAPL